MLVPTPSKSQFDATLERELAAAAIAIIRTTRTSRNSAVNSRALSVLRVKQLPINTVAGDAGSGKDQLRYISRHYGGLLRTFDNKLGLPRGRRNQSLFGNTEPVDGPCRLRLSQYVQFQWQAEDSATRWFKSS
jgi:hypothetical protein